MPLRTQFPSRSTVGRPLAAVAVGVGAVVLIAACSSGGSGSGSTPTGSPSASPQRGAGSGRGAVPGVSGTIAEVAAGSIEVQNQATGQVTVKYTAKTAIVVVKSTTVAAVKPGTCVLAAAAPSQSGSGSPSPVPTPSTTFTAATVFLSQRENGKCTLADLGGSGARTGGTRAPRSGQFPSGFPTGARRSGANGRNFGFAERAAGSVTKVSGSTITVSGTNPRTNAAVTYTVDVDASTKYSQTVATTSKALAVGQCASATGRADDTGAVTATSIRVSPPTNGNCTIGFGAGRRPFGGSSSTNG